MIKLLFAKVFLLSLVFSSCQQQDNVAVDESENVSVSLNGDSGCDSQEDIEKMLKREKDSLNSFSLDNSPTGGCSLGSDFNFDDQFD